MKLTQKTLALLLATVMLFGGVVGGTVAWLVSSVETVTNTFTVGNIDITLTESDTDNDSNIQANSYKMIPGTVYTKDPKVTVLAGSEACYLFLKVTETNNESDFILYVIDSSENIDDNKWIPLTGVENVYYREVAAVPSTDTDGESFGILTSGTHSTEFSWGADQVLIDPDITKEQMDTLKASENTPTLTFKACAVQSANMADVNAAWDQVPAVFKS